MITPSPKDVTQLLEDWSHGDQGALDRLVGESAPMKGVKERIAKLTAGLPPADADDLLSRASAAAR